MSKKPQSKKKTPQKNIDTKPDKKTPTETRIQVLDTFHHFFESNKNKDILILAGGAGSGKSHQTGIYLIQRALSEKRNILVTRSTNPSLMTSCYPLIKNLSKKFGIKISENKTQQRIILPNGSTFLFKSLDDEEKIKSIFDISMCWYEEASEAKNKNEIEQIRLRLRSLGLKNQLVMTLNPVVKSKWIKEAFSNQPNVGWHFSSYKDNEINLPTDYVQNLESKRDTNPQYWRVYGLGEWGSLQDIIFGNWKISHDPLPDDYESRCYGLDFGFNDPVSLIEIRKKDNTYYVHQWIYQSGLTNAKLIQKMNQLNIDKNIPIYCDSAEPKSIEDLKIAGFKTKKANKKSIFDSVIWCSDQPIIITSSSDKLIDELGCYEWKKDKHGNKLDEPVGGFDHAIDAMRYGMFTHWGRVHKTPSITFF